MDITTNDIFSDINGYVISDFNHLNNGKIFKVYTDNLGIISIYSKSTETFFSPYSKYNFKLIKGENFFYCTEFELLEYNFLKNKNYILFLNFISEIILKSSLEGIENCEIFDLITEVLKEYNNFNVKIILIYFVFKYMKFSGYHIIFEKKVSKNYNFNIMELEIKDLKDSFLDNKYNYKLNFNEYDFLLNLNNKDTVNDINNLKENVNYSRILGVLINALCLNLSVNKLNTLGLFD